MRYWKIKKGPQPTEAYIPILMVPILKESYLFVKLYQIAFIGDIYTKRTLDIHNFFTGLPDTKAK